MPEITRIAPSPTGMMHIGTARTAYINYLAAKSTGGEFILRIDDTDTERNKPEYTQIILDSLDWLGLEPDAIYYQSQRLNIYAMVARTLLQSKKAFVADNGAIILSPITASLESFTDTIAGEIKITDTNYEQINKGTVLVRGGDKKGQPTYQFCSVVDDYFLEINHIIRGVDHITNTPKQIAIYNTLFDGEIGWVNIAREVEVDHLPKFTHMGLIFKDKKKLSKRDGAASLLQYRDEGYSPEAILNWMLLMGWSLRVPRGDKQLEKIANAPINKELAIELFNQGSLKNSPCNFSIDKLNSLQKYYAKVGN